MIQKLQFNARYGYTHSYTHAQNLANIKKWFGVNNMDIHCKFLQYFQYQNYLNKMIGWKNKCKKLISAIMF